MGSDILDVEFYSDDPRRKSRRRLDEILRNGVDQLAIACAFCTGAGIQVLLPHVARLRNPGSFAVVSSQWPTDYAGLELLHDQMPGNLFVHWGAMLPYEMKVGAALMHSKVFYARAGDECWLWTGSHNLTGTATQGGNCEAAVILHGAASEQPFVDALKHLQAIRNESKPYDPEMLPVLDTEPADLIAIHAETDALPSLPLPWHVHLCLDSADFDKLLGPPANVRLFLYPRGSLHYGWQYSTAIAAFAGSLTGQNLTARNPNAPRAGAPAVWNAADLDITESHGVLMVGPPGPLGPDVATQVLLHIESKSDPHESLLPAMPKVERKSVPGETRLSDIDPDMRRFFSKQSIDGTKLVNVPYDGRRLEISMPMEDVRRTDVEKILSRLSQDEGVPVAFSEIQRASREKRHPFIVRVKSRLSGD